MYQLHHQHIILYYSQSSSLKKLKKLLVNYEYRLYHAVEVYTGMYKRGNRFRDPRAKRKGL